ncbi:hypothetical protein LAUMK40_00863 [Mycobacterium kansasii]|nr:hypothetical protein LAUMK40_00863 [Mycobacterium kansasii]
MPDNISRDQLKTIRCQGLVGRFTFFLTYECITVDH